MNNDSSKLNSYQEYEIDLGFLFRTLNKNKKFIATFSLVFSFFVFLFHLSQPEILPIYQSRIYFLAPSQLEVTKLNTILNTEETEKSLYNKFLTKTMSVDFQKKVFLNKDYGELLNSEYDPSIDFDVRGDEFINTIRTLTSEIIAKSKYGSYEVTWNISMTGNNAILISDFLNDLAESANNEVLNELKKVSELKVNNRLKLITLEKNEIEKNSALTEALINRVIDLNIEEERLKLYNSDLQGIASVHIDQAAIPAIKPLNIDQNRKSLVMAFQIIAGFLLSILIVYIRNIYYFEKQ